MKRLFLLLLCCAALLCGCRKELPEPTVPSVTTQPTVTPTTEPTEPPTEPMSYRMEQGVTFLEYLEPDTSPSFVSLGGGDVAMMVANYATERTTITVMNVITGEIRAERTFENYPNLLDTAAGDLMAIYTFDDPEDKSGKTVTILNRDLETVQVVHECEMNYLPSPELDRLYYVKSEQLRYVDVATGEVGVYPMPGDFHVVYIQSISAEGIMTLNLYESPFIYGAVSAALDLASGELKLLRDDFYTSSFYDGGAIVQQYDYDFGVEYVGWIAWQEDLASLRQICSSDMQEQTRFSTLRDCPYLLGVHAEREGDEEYGYDADTVWLISPEGGAGCHDLSADGINQMLLYPCYLPEEDLIISSIYIPEEGRSRIVLIDPQALEMTPLASSTQVDFRPVSDEVLTRLRENIQVPPVREELQPLRDRADALEQQYGMKILLSNQCEPLIPYVEYTPQLSETVYDEAEAIGHMLDGMETALARFPAGFFQQFTSDAQGNGIVVMLTGTMDSTFNVIGLHTTMRSWNVIAMDINYHYDADPTFSHELMHAIEDFIDQAYMARGEYFSDWREEYESFNPEDFTYDCYHDEDMPWHDGTYYGGADPVYFVDQYACSFGTEDRARLMEYVMSRPWEAEEIMRSAPMQGKMHVLCREIRQAFDTTGWEETTWWERFEPET